MKAMLVSVLAISLSALGCDQKPNPHVEWPPGADWDGKPAVCEAQCDRLRELGCPEGKPSCQDDCKTLTDKSLWTAKDTHCVANATNKDELKACRVKCEPLPK